MRILEVVVALAIREFEHRRPKLTSRERRKITSRKRMYLFMKASCVVLRGVSLHGAQGYPDRVALPGRPGNSLR